MRSQYEEEIAKNATGRQTKQIKKRSRGCKLAKQIIEYSQKDNQKDPNAQ